MTHKHRMSTTKTGPYFCAAEGAKQNPAAHGGTQTVEHCECGAWRRTNSNGRHEERGSWQEPE